MEGSIFSLYEELKNKTYQHSNYSSFFVKDPKIRHIHKACVRDRILHHAIFRVLYSTFDKQFIFDSYSCRNKKGTHRAINRLKYFARKAGKNNTKPCYILKCDIKKYFDSIDQNILLNLIRKIIKDNDALWLIEKVIKSFPKGLPLGNITSQLFANIYLNELDKFIKHNLREKFYIRYCDDFTILNSADKNLIYKIDYFLKNNLRLYLHPAKIIIRKYHQGIDFLGYVIFPHFRILRVKTIKRIIKNLKTKEIEVKNKKITKKSFNQTVQSYLGVLKHCDSLKIRKEYFFKHIGMIIFLYGEDSYRSRQKLDEIISRYKEIRKNGFSFSFLNIEDLKDSGSNIFSGLRISANQISMFDEKKFQVLTGAFTNKDFSQNFLKEADIFLKSKDVFLIHEKSKVDKKDVLFKLLEKKAKCQEFKKLEGLLLKNWIRKEISNTEAKIEERAFEKLFSFATNDLWQISNEIKKLASYRKGKTIREQDIDIMVKPKIENDIFKTIEAISKKEKKQALDFLQKHIENGDHPLYLLSMISFQFRNLLIVKDLFEKRNTYELILQKSGLHPFVVKKSYFLVQKFSFLELKKIYQKIFEVDLDIKTGRIGAEMALNLFVAQI